ncbi:phosphotransferase [Rhodococcus sp. NPDC059968]|uniref:phosphotransferase n=1 Tax=Rhodococcus sp. NPDC059968 TaxID=3347017 RepID=UPI00366AF3CB
MTVGEPLTLAHAADAMARVKELAPEVLWLDLDYGVLVTRYVPGTNWEQQLLAGKIDARTFAIAGASLRGIHEISPGTSDYPDHILPLPAGRVPFEADTSVAHLHERLRTCGRSLLHGDFNPRHVVITPDRRLTVARWSSVALGSTLSDVAQLLASLLLRSHLQPYTEDWYIDAGRAFLSAYGDTDQTLLPSLVGVELLALIDRPQQLPDTTISDLTSRAIGLLSHTTPLPW